MRGNGWRLLAGALACAALGTACATTPRPAGPAGSPRAVSSTASTAPSGAPSGARPVPHRDIAELVRAVRARIGGERGAHIATSVALAGNPTTGDGVIGFPADGGRPPDLDVDTALPAGAGEPPVHVRLVAVGDQEYADFARTPGAAPSWIALSPRGTDLFSDVLEELTTSLRQAADPQAYLTLAAAGGTLTGSRPERIGGIDTVRYDVHIDAARAEQDAAAAPLAKQLLAGGVRQLDVQLWTDATDQPVRLSSAQTIAQFGPVSGTVTFDGWGRPVRISAPPPDQVGH